MSELNRRSILKLAAAAAALPVSALAQARGRIVIVGAGFGGATCARYLRRAAPLLDITIVEQSNTITTCPFSNGVVGGLIGIDSIAHSLDGLRRVGITVQISRVTGIDPERRSVALEGGAALAYDRLVLSPGVDFRWDAISGYDEAAAEVMPHAWKAGQQTLLLRRQLEAMPDGGVVVMTIPTNPYRCPPGPYERASLIAWYLQKHKPRSKLILLDAKDTFSKQGLFLEAWKQRYGQLIEWVPFAKAGNLLRVDPGTMMIETEFANVKADVANIIPPQRAGAIVQTAGLASGRDWCTVDAMTMESTIVPRVHIIGDAIIAGSMPKSAFAAGSQGKACAFAIAALQSGAAPPAPSFVNTCYSLVAPDYGISVADVFRIGSDGSITSVQGAGGVSPLGASAEFRQREADYARGWYASMTAEIYH